MGKISLNIFVKQKWEKGIKETEVLPLVAVVTREIEFAMLTREIIKTS